MRERGELDYYRKEKESTKPTGPGAGGLRGRVLDEGPAVQGEYERLWKHSTTKPSRPTVSHWLQEHEDALISQTTVATLGLRATAAGSGRNKGT